MEELHDLEPVIPFIDGAVSFLRKKKCNIHITKRVHHLGLKEIFALINWCSTNDREIDA